MFFYIYVPIFKKKYWSWILAQNLRQYPYLYIKTQFCCHLFCYQFSFLLLFRNLRLNITNNFLAVSEIYGISISLSNSNFVAKFQFCCQISFLLSVINFVAKFKFWYHMSISMPNSGFVAKFHFCCQILILLLFSILLSTFDFVVKFHFCCRISLLSNFTFVA